MNKYIGIREVSMNRMMCLLGTALLILHTSFFVSCKDLDEAPDNRTEIDTVDKVQQLLTSGYPASSAAIICELSGDNLLDNNVVVPFSHFDGYYDFHEQAYAWEDIDNYSTGESDTPYSVWESHYQGIAVANHAIQAMTEMSLEPAKDPELAHSWGEAHILRAYLHFVLVNLFAEAYKDEAQSSRDIGIPYVSEVENTVNVDYSDPKYRKSVAEIYRCIEADILEGIDLINDSKYKVPAYHFNHNAANAFAARFFLFKRDYLNCLKYANNALGGSPTLREWKAINRNSFDAMLNNYNDEKQSCNFLIQPTYSLQFRMLRYNARFAINEGAKVKTETKEWHVPSTLDATLWGKGPNWSPVLPGFEGMVYVNGEGQKYGAWLFCLREYFEFTDKIAGIGYVHQIYHPFTAEETLLCRAEAKLYLGYEYFNQIDEETGEIDKKAHIKEAIQDLNLWTTAHQATQSLKLDDIKRFYRRTLANNDFVNNLYELIDNEANPSVPDTTWFAQKMGFEKVLKDEELNVLDCILHFRRIETTHEGNRWFDIKRYGMKVYHFYRDANEDEIHIDSLTWNDPRRVLQIPNNVIKAGFPANREQGSGGGSADAGFLMPAYNDSHNRMHSNMN